MDSYILVQIGEFTNPIDAGKMMITCDKISEIHGRSLTEKCPRCIFPTHTHTHTHTTTVLVYSHTHKLSVKI